MVYVKIILIMVLLTIGSSVIADTQIKKISLGETKVQLEIIRSGRGPVFVALHENEATSITAAKKLLSKNGGTLIILRHGGKRNVTFTLGGTTYNFDPNRIFTREGIRRTLKGGSSKEAVTAVRNLADSILMEISNRPIVALHNNSDGSYSLTSYLPGNHNSADAKSVHQVPGLDADDFFFTTDSSVYDRAKEGGYNVVLQSRSVTNDGSLSVYAFSKGIPYVNVETQHGHLAVQQQMLTWLDKNWR